MAWENGLGKSEMPEGFNSRTPRCSGLCVEQFLVSPQKEEAVAALMPDHCPSSKGRPLAPLQRHVFMCFAVTLEEYHHGGLSDSFPGCLLLNRHCIYHLGFLMLSFWEGKDSMISSALRECSFFRESPRTKNQILPSPSSVLLCVFPYQKSQQEEAQPYKCSSSVVFSKCKLRTMPRTLPSQRTMLGIFEQREHCYPRGQASQALVQLSEFPVSLQWDSILFS